jgi:hypothetical protein
MGWYHIVNLQKIALCEREGITEARRDEFRDMGDESPLFRCVQLTFPGSLR